MLRKLPPGPKSWLPLGHLISFARDPLSFLSEMAASFGELVHFRAAGRHYFLLNHPDMVKEVLITQAKKFSKGDVLERAKKVLGESLFTSDGETHTQQRRMVQPAFHRTYIDGYAKTMASYTLRLQSQWKDGAEFDLTAETLRLTLAIVGKTLFDADLEQGADEVQGAMLRLTETFNRISNPIAGLLDRLPLPSNRRFYAARAELDALIYGMIAARKNNPGERKDLLSLLMLAGEHGAPMNDQKLRDESMGLFLAGYETMAYALSFGLYVLAADPALQEAARAECEAVLAGRQATAEDAERLPLLKRIFSEALRLYPPAWVLPRRAQETLKLGEWTLERGDTVLISPWISHRDPRVFLDPARFDADRFLPENKAKLPAYAYYPFGAGQRSCVGEAYSWMEGLLVMASTLQQWRLELAEPAPLKLSALVLLRPEGVLKIRAHALKDAA